MGRGWGDGERLMKGRQLDASATSPPSSTPILPLVSLFQIICLFTYLWLCWAFGDVCVGFPLVTVSGGYSLGAVWGLLIVVAFLFQGTASRVHGLSSFGVQGLSCPEACGGSSWPVDAELLSPALTGEFLTTGPPGSLSVIFLITFLLLFYFSYCSSWRFHPFQHRTWLFLPVLNRNLFLSGLEGTKCRSSMCEVLSENVKKSLLNF